MLRIGRANAQVRRRILLDAEWSYLAMHTLIQGNRSLKRSALTGSLGSATYLRMGRSAYRSREHGGIHARSSRDSILTGIDLRFCKSSVNRKYYRWDSDFLVLSYAIGASQSLPVPMPQRSEMVAGNEAEGLKPIAASQNRTMQPHRAKPSKRPCTST